MPFLKHIGVDYFEIDLNGYICSGLRKLGIQHISNSDINTATNTNYFSHHRCTYINKEEQEVRFICGVIMLDTNEF